MRPLNSIFPITPVERDYFAKRAREEQAAAERATCAVARERHEELADMYRLRARIASDDLSGLSVKVPARSEGIHATMWL